MMYPVPCRSYRRPDLALIVRNSDRACFCVVLELNCIKNKSGNKYMMRRQCRKGATGARSRSRKRSTPPPLEEMGTPSTHPEEERAPARDFGPVIQHALRPTGRIGPRIFSFFSDFTCAADLAFFEICVDPDPGVYPASRFASSPSSGVLVFR